jgi:hypothetical protein
VSAPDAEKAARFASAEAVRGSSGNAQLPEFRAGPRVAAVRGPRSRTAAIPQPIAYLMESGLTYLVQGVPRQNCSHMV